MANRYINNNQTVTQVTPPAPDTLVSDLAEVGQNIIKKSQEAKIVENMSAAQLEVGQLSNQFQKQYESDPFNEQGIKDFRMQRQEILDKYGEGISPIFGRAWKDNAAKLASSNDLGVQAWGFKQAEVNTKQSMAITLENNLLQTGLDGEAYAAGKLTLPEALLNVHTSLETVRQFGDTNLGATSTETIMHDLGQDHIKTFISSVAVTNPVMALRLMDDPGVKSEVTNQEEWAKFRDAVDTKAINFQDTAKQQEILTKLKQPNAMLASGKVLSYAQIKQASGGMSPEAEKYFLHANGYTKADGTGGDGPKWDMNEKAEHKTDVYDQIIDLSKSDDIAPQQVQVLQDAIYKGMTKKALTQKEGADFLTQLVDPYVKQKEEGLTKFETGEYNPFKANKGFSEMQQFYKDDVEIVVPTTSTGKAASSGLAKRVQATNSVNKANLYDNYWNSLKVQAVKKGVSVDDLMRGPDADTILAKAKQDATTLYKAKNSAVLKVQPSIPITDIKKLLDNPQKAGEFDKMYGPGSANRILGVGKK